MKKEMILAILVISSVLLVIGFASAAKDTPKIFVTNGCDSSSDKVNSYSLGNEVFVKVKNLDQGMYPLKIKWKSGDASCNPEKVPITGTLTVGSDGKYCFDTNHAITSAYCGTYKVVALDSNGDEKFTDTFTIDNGNVPSAPEFGPIVGILTVLGALGVFFVVRSK
jgi:hypothetical protein